MAAKTKPVKRRESCTHGILHVGGRGCPPEPAVALVPSETLVWEKLSYKRYVARGLGGASLMVVRSGTPQSFNETWHPIVFGNRYAFARSFKTWAQAALAAERCAVTYARRALTLLQSKGVTGIPESETR